MNRAFNDSKAAGQSVFHCHFHDIPRYNGDVPTSKGGVGAVIPNKQKYYTMKIISTKGNQNLMNKEKTLFLCSKMTPIELYGNVFKWTDSLTSNSRYVYIQT